MAAESNTRASKGKKAAADTVEVDEHGLIKPVSQPLPKPTEWTFAESYNLGHSAVLLAFHLASFKQLVADPVTTLRWTLVPLAAAQVLYCIICLPTPSTASSSTATRKKRVSFASSASSVKDGKTNPSLQTKITTAFLAILLTTALAIPLMTAGLVTFGAPILLYYIHDILAAAHLAFLAALPLFYVHGVNARIWWEVSAAYLPFDYVWGGAVGTVVGAWLGAIPIPLDWDRDWQAWPITIVTGAYLGCAVFRVLGRFVFYGWRISLDERPAPTNIAPQKKKKIEAEPQEDGVQEAMRASPRKRARSRSKGRSP